MIKIFKFLKSRVSTIIFIILLIIFAIILIIDSIDTVEQNEVTIIRTSTISEKTKTYEELKQENEEYKLLINQLQSRIDCLIVENDAYEDNVIKHIEINDVFNPHTKSNLSVEQLNTMLENTGLNNQGQAFYDMEQTWNVNALFAMGVAMHESANGYALANTHNYFGFRGYNGWMSFESAYNCIQYFGQLISTNYNDRLTIQAVQIKYCPDGSSWSDRVKEHMTRLKLKC